jgi:RNA polymerase sigma factor (sigma-70 family)
MEEVFTGPEKKKKKAERAGNTAASPLLSVDSSSLSKPPTSPSTPQKTTRMTTVQSYHNTKQGYTKSQPVLVLSQFAFAEFEETDDFGFGEGEESRGKFADFGGERFEGEKADNAQVYLNQIGKAELLTKEQEAVLGEAVRTAYENLQVWLVGSGYVCGLLVQRAKEEMGRKACAEERKHELHGKVARAEAALANNRERFSAGAVPAPEMWAESAAAFGELLQALELRPDFSLELLEKLKAASKGEATGTDSTGEGFEHLNLMSAAANRLFLNQCLVLEAAAIRARNRLVVPNLRLVVALAKKMKHATLSREDLIQEGNIGLVTAAERFDARKGNRFSTFAVSLINSAMRRENDNQGRTVRLPVHQCEALRRLNKTHADLSAELKRQPSVEELASKANKEPWEIQELLNWKETLASLDESVGSDGDIKLGDVLEDPNSWNPSAEWSDFARKMNPYLEDLENAQRDVVSMLFGVRGYARLSEEEAAAVLGVRVAEVKALCRNAFASLRASIESPEAFYAQAA